MCQLPEFFQVCNVQFFARPYLIEPVCISINLALRGVASASTRHVEPARDELVS